MKTDKWKSCEITRRTALAGATALAAAGVVGVGRSARGDEGTPKKGGHFRCGLTGASTSDNLDPSLASSVFTSVVPFTVGNCLAEINNENQLVPELAETWEASADFATWTFKLRSGVEFHDGKTLGVEDVVDSLNRHRGPDSKSVMAALMIPVTEIKAGGNDSVVVTLNQGNADFPYVMAGQHAAIVRDGGEDYSVGIGTGPYQVESFEPGVGLYTTRNPNYWKEGRAHFDRVDLIGINDPSARLSALLTGEVDAMDRLESKVVERLQGNSAIEVVNKIGFRHCTMPMRIDIPPFDDVNVRLAIKNAVPREEILNLVLNGFGTLGNDHPVSPIQEFYAEEIEQRTYDPEKARFHLKQAGLDSVPVELHVAEAAFAGAVDAAALTQERARACGIDITLKREPDDGYWSQVWLKAPWCVAYWSGRPTADWILSLGYTADAKWNASRWYNPKFDQLLVAARVEKDEAKRHQMYVEAQRMVRDESGQIVPFFLNHVYARNSSVRAGVEGGNYGLDGYHLAERWWFS